MSLAQRIVELAARIAQEMKHMISADHPGLARAWVNFGWDGEQVRIYAAHQVEEVYRLSTGRYRVIFSERMPDVHYTWFAFVRHSVSGRSIKFAAARAEVEDKTPRDVEIACISHNGALADSTEINLIIYR